MSTATADTTSANLVDDTLNPHWGRYGLVKNNSKLCQTRVAAGLNNANKCTHLCRDNMGHRNILTISILIDVLQHFGRYKALIGIEIFFMKYCDFREHD